MIRKKRESETQVSEHELRGMTADLTDAHHESLPRLHESLEAWRDEGVEVTDGMVALTTATPGRRGFLLGTGVVLGGAAIAAVSGRSAWALTGGRALPGSRPGVAPTKTQKLTGDLAVVALAASIENLAVATYGSAIQAAQAGHLGTVPPAVVTFAMTAQSQHRDHAAAWNAVLSSAHKKKVTGVDLTVKQGVVDPAFAQVSDVAGLAKLALELETSAAATYLAAIDVVKSPAGIATAATIEPVELQHAAILNFILGNYPVPDSFTPTAAARSTSDQIG
jgi:Ferritin-like domain